MKNQIRILLAVVALALLAGGLALKHGNEELAGRLSVPQGRASR